jgi:type IV secretion system protein VirB6
MSPCDPLVQGASAGVAASLRAVDCVSAETTASAFTRLFGTDGALLPALTALLTIYIAAFALLLLTGRSSLSVSSLTPRMFALGLVLTFTTSWVAYQGVVWNLATGAPDQIAGVLMGTAGSATQMFADRIDILFGAIAETAGAATQGASATPGQTQGSFTPSNLMWLSALLLLLATVGLLVTARIALAVLLALGPVFIVFALFGGTRGLFAGWLRAVVLMAVTPLFAVLGGAIMIEMAVPVVAALRGPDGIDGRGAMALFVIASVHCALMALALRVASTTVGGWKVFGMDSSGDPASSRADQPVATNAAAAMTPTPAASRAPIVISQGAYAASDGMSAQPQSGGGRSVRNIIIPATATGVSTGLPQARRARGIGSRFASRAAPQRIS